MIVVGWIVMALVALVARWISQLVVVSGTHPLEAMLVGIVIGAIIRNMG